MTLYKDSAFALGTAIKRLQYPQETNKIEQSSKVYEIMKYLAQAEYLPVSTIAELLGCRRIVAQKLMGKMWKSRLVKCVEIATYSNPKMLFKLWMPSTMALPKNAMEACKLAMLGTFYGRAKNMLAEFEWGIVRSKDRKTLTAEIVYMPGGEKEKTRLVIDAPRRGEKPNADADIFIFPTVEEAKTLTPASKRYTADLILLNRNIDFKNMISDPVNRSTTPT